MTGDDVGTLIGWVVFLGLGGLLIGGLVYVVGLAIRAGSHRELERKLREEEKK